MSGAAPLPMKDMKEMESYLPPSDPKTVFIAKGTKSKDVQKGEIECEHTWYTVAPLSVDTPEIRTSTVLRTVCEVPNEMPFTYVYPTSLKVDTSLFRLADSTSYTLYTKCQMG